MEGADAGFPCWRAGNRAKGDCLVTWTPGPGFLKLELESSVAPLFGRAILEAARKEALAHGASGRISLVDDGALDYLVAARVEAALAAGGLSPLAGAGTARPAAPAAARPPLSLAERRDRRRRTRLYIPGNQAELPVNSGLFGADCILLDLEDSVALERKAEARIHVRRLLSSQRAFFGASELAVRVNPLGSGLGEADLSQIVPAAPDVLVLPKCESAQGVEAWDREVSRLEAEAGLAPGSILFMPLVETALGVASVTAIASSSSRNVAICFGAEDYRRDLGIEASPLEEEIFVARCLVAIGARAAGIGAQDSVFSKVDDNAGLEASARRALALGFQGKGILHPGQIETVHRVFSLAAGEIESARRIVEALEKAEAEGRGVASLDGAMIDAPVAARARRLLSLAAAQAAKEGSNHVS